MSDYDDLIFQVSVLKRELAEAERKLEECRLLLIVMRKLERAECVRLLREYSATDHLPLVKFAADWLERQP